MYNLYDSLPESIEVNGRLFPILTDFRAWLKFGSLIDKKCFYSDISYLLEVPQDRLYLDEDVFQALYNFYNLQPKYPKSSSGKNVVSFDDDAPYIYASFMSTYGIDLLTAELHWWQFLALFRGLFIRYKEITSYRGYEGDDKELLKARSDWQLSETKKGDKDIIKILLHGGDFTKGG